MRDRQTEYYQALREADKSATATVFIEFMLDAILQALLEIHSSEQVSERVRTVLRALQDGPKGKQELLAILGLSNAYMNHKRNLVPILERGLIEMTIPDKPRSRLQKYRLTE